MKIKIINKGGYCFGGTLKLPVVVEAFNDLSVNGSELIKQGADPLFIGPDVLYHFSEKDVEVVPQTTFILATGDKDMLNLESSDRRFCKAIRQGDQMQCVCGLAWDIDDTDLPECII